MGSNQRGIHEAMKVRALGLAWTAKFIKGNNQTDPREFDGLAVRVNRLSKNTGRYYRKWISFVIIKT